MMENLLIVSDTDCFCIHVATLIYFKGVDGQVFDGLAAGTYTIFIEATATNNTNEVVFDTVGPVLLAAGANATTSEAIGKYSCCLLATLRLAAFLPLLSCSCMLWKKGNKL